MRDRRSSTRISEGSEEIIVSVHQIITELPEHNREFSEQELSKQPVDAESRLPIISRLQVANHYSEDDCWLIINDLVYDVTSLLDTHPGGDWIIMEYAGCDASLAFTGFGHGSRHITFLNKTCLVGILPPEQRTGKVLTTTPSFR